MGGHATRYGMRVVDLFGLLCRPLRSYADATFRKLALIVRGWQDLIGTAINSSFHPPSHILRETEQHIAVCGISFKNLFEDVDSGHNPYFLNSCTYTKHKDPALQDPVNCKRAHLGMLVWHRLQLHMDVPFVDRADFRVAPKLLTG